MAVCFLLLGCGVSKQSAEQPYFAPEVIADCPALQTLPDHDIDMATVEILWKNDRLDYLKCASSKAELIETLKERGMISDGK